MLYIIHFTDMSSIKRKLNLGAHNAGLNASVWRRRPSTAARLSDIRSVVAKIKMRDSDGLHAIKQRMMTYMTVGFHAFAINEGPRVAADEG